MAVQLNVSPRSVRPSGVGCCAEAVGTGAGSSNNAVLGANGCAGIASAGGIGEGPQSRQSVAEALIAPRPGLPKDLGKVGM